MYIDSFTIAAIAVFLGIFILTAIVINIWSHRSQRERIEHLSRRLNEVSQNVLIPTEEARHLCCAVRQIYPEAQLGLDFQVDDEGRGAYIRQWLFDQPQPDEEQIQAVLKIHHQQRQASQYREERMRAYPPVGDQLDALYKARQGDDFELVVIDRHIAEVKARYPRPDACGQDCLHPVDPPQETVA